MTRSASGGGGLPEVVSSAAIRRMRGPKQPVDPWRPLLVLDEKEVAEPGIAVACRVILLAGAECPYTCAMCDLWRHTLDGPTPAGALPAQIETALAMAPDPLIGTPAWVKLYNASNVTDRRAVPEVDLPRIAALVAGFERVIVETHPRLVDASLSRFAATLSGRLEVALGLETVDRRFLPWLNKQMTPEDFAAACGRLLDDGIDARAFVLLGLPGATEQASIDAAIDAARFAAEAGCRHVSLIPTRAGNGLLDRLAAEGRFAPVSATAAEAALAGAIATLPSACVVTLDLWDWERMGGLCERCRDLRRGRIDRMNLSRALPPPSSLDCGCRHGV